MDVPTSVLALLETKIALYIQENHFRLCQELLKFHIYNFPL